jgi:N-formylglutamate amidohydrolase
MILHIPHASSIIPDNLRNQIVLSDDELKSELLFLTDAYTDELYMLPSAKTIIFPISRLLVDVERFPDDTEEPMSKVGMGMIYTRTTDGKKLKRDLNPQERSFSVTEYYDKHHKALLAEVERELEVFGSALIIDCHSFPDQPLKSDMDQSVPRPDFCIGTDPFHTPQVLIEAADATIKKKGYSVSVNRPYAGTIVPLKFYKKDSRVISIMVEINRSLYMDMKTGMKNKKFKEIKSQINNLLFILGTISDGKKRMERNSIG